MEQSPKVKYLCEKYADMRRWRSVWDSHFDDIQHLIRPHTRSFTSALSVRGERKHDRIFDATASWSLEQFAAGLSSYLTSPNDRWFHLMIRGVPYSDIPNELAEWMETVSDILYHLYAAPESNQNSALHETYLDIGSFGTGVIMQQELDSYPVMFRAWPLADCWLAENHLGLVDTLYRRYFPTTRMLKQQFPATENLEPVQKAKEDKTWEIVHAVEPRTDRNPHLPDKMNKAFASYYFCEELPEVISEGGYDEFPYHVPRWTKLSGEFFGRSPAMSVLPDVKMLNQMVKEIIFSAQLANRPPLVFEDDTMLLPVKSVTPGSILYKHQGSEMPAPLLSGTQPMLTLEMINELRDSIRRAFYVDFLLRPKKKERQTTAEIMDDRDEMLRQMGPMIARIQAELCGPMIQRTYAIAERRGLLPPKPDLPEEFNGMPIELAYSSPASKAQTNSKSGALNQYLQDIATIAQFDPSVTQVLNFPELAAEMAKLRDVSTRVLKTPQQLEQERRAAAQQAQMQQMAEAAPQMSGAIKDIAQARQADPTLLGNL